jgi:hypothetical protein
MQAHRPSTRESRFLRLTWCVCMCVHVPVSMPVPVPVPVPVLVPVPVSMPVHIALIYKRRYNGPVHTEIAC